MTHITETHEIASPTLRRFSILKWLIDLDVAYRSKAKFDRLDDAALNDMGLTRSQRDQAFLQQFKPRR